MYASTVGFSQETEAKTEAEEKSAPMERNIFADAGYAFLGITVSNVFLNLNSRLGEQTFANITYKKIWYTLTHYNWFWEEGDRFLVNQFGHPYQGSTYFASARINGFNFVESMLFAPLGSLMWEVLMEPTPSINDFISTTTGGIALGEMLHRLFLEVDSPSIGATIGSFLISPLGGFNKIYNRHPRESGGGNIYEAQVRTGVEKTFAFFPQHEEQAASWKYPGGHINVNVVYGNPFIQESKTPYNHFYLYAGFTTNTTSYHAAIVSDGYLLSFNPVQTDSAFTSTGLSLHFDFFNATNDLIDNLGYGNIQFSSNAIGWTVKHKYCFSQNFYFETKAHAAIIYWGNTMYNGKYITNNYWVPLSNTRSTYGMGENVKLFFTLSHNKAGKLDLAAHGYHILAIPVTKNHIKGNAFFIFGSLDYCFPLGEKIGIGTRGTFWGLFGLYDSAENVKRFMASNALYLSFSL
jgi:hypothetical protein